MIELTYNGHKIPVETIEIDSVDSFQGLGNAARDVSYAAQELTFNISYWNYLWLAKMVTKQNPKKGKLIRKLAEKSNPTRLLFVEQSK